MERRPPHSRTLTGAWIETEVAQKEFMDHGSRTLTGAWIETGGWVKSPTTAGGRTLTGAWIETIALAAEEIERQVAPSRVRGLKRLRYAASAELCASHPHGCVD